MAKKKKKVGKIHRKKKMGAIKQDGSLEAFAGGILGFLGASLLEENIQSLSANMLGGAQLIAGGLLAYLPKNWFLKGIGLGIGINGGNTLYESFAGVTQTGMIDKSQTFNPARRINGYRDVAKIAGAGAIGDFPKPGMIAGRFSRVNRRAYGGMYK